MNKLKSGLYFHPNSYTMIEVKENGLIDIGWAVGHNTINFEYLSWYPKFLNGCVYIGEI